MPRSHGKLFGPSLPRARRKVWNPGGRRLLVSTLFGKGWTVYVRRVPRHPLRTEFLAAPVARRAYTRKRR